jgi:hypothetical protein
LINGRLAFPAHDEALQTEGFLFSDEEPKKKKDDLAKREKDKWMVNA